jgi:hypothetical protein
VGCLRSSSLTAGIDACVDISKTSNEGVACCDSFVVKFSFPESSTNPRARLVESSRAAVTKGSWMSDETSRVGARIKTKMADCC